MEPAEVQVRVERKSVFSSASTSALTFRKYGGLFSANLLHREAGCLPIHHPDSSQNQHDTEDFTYAHRFFQ